ncbi:hypothetical protein EXN66_Car013706 [Channa argus]|uniref:Immunoglobulin V-set domain-containing protein n=1 Tax=Channa argus TaxID=215402 RepID=A0A6G1Q651_CHAAH|nr:hypothetical protein EXN66_Car013706 [Channa argus]KAK2899679.1 hypothetical protein Q8A73_012808 [Channa argus]
MKKLMQHTDVLLAHLQINLQAPAGKESLKMPDVGFTYKPVTREKVIWILLFSILVSSVFGIFVVKWTRTSYQEEENNNITIRWNSQLKMDPSVTSLVCALQSQPLKVLYQMKDGVEVTESQHEQFAGRVQLDRDTLREGQMRLHLSTVRTEDSGDYKCDLASNFDKNKGRWELEATVHFVLNVLKNSRGDIRDISSTTAGPKQSPEESRQEVIWIIATAALATVTVAAAVLFVVAIVFQLRKPSDKKILKNPI